LQLPVGWISDRLVNGRDSAERQRRSDAIRARGFEPDEAGAREADGLVTGSPAAERDSPDLATRLAGARPLVLDGATGTELERRHVSTSLPLWSAHALVHAPEVVAAIHADYAAAGADILTANTFRTQRRTLARGGWGDRAGELTSLAVDLARQAANRVAGERKVHVVGSAPTLEDCYRPDLVPDETALRREHGEHARHLAEAGVDAILVETMNSIREAVAALGAARATGLPALVSFVCWEGAHLLSGEPLRDGLAAALSEMPVAVLVNCLPPSNVAACLPVLRDSNLPFGVYANLGVPVDEGGSKRSEECEPAVFAELAARWRAAGARILGGCCGTTPAHIHALAQRLRK
jgi:S-methylmethionine-dependent homocysteine/selenocysteine methylase